MILWARSEGLLTPFVVAAVIANFLCLLIGVLALVMTRFRTPRRDDGRDDDVVGARFTN
jgi:hypothetical protein